MVLCANYLFAINASLCLRVNRLRQNFLPASLGRLTCKTMTSLADEDPDPCSITLPNNTQHAVHDRYSGDRFEVKRSRSRFVSSLMLFCALMFGLSSVAQAGEFCSIFPDPGSPGDGLIDGSDPATVQFFIDNNVTQITVDTNCTFRNWDPLNVTINFQTPGTGAKPVYLIVFDNVNYTGNMACANIDHKIWMVNGSSSDFSSKCQDLFIPVEAINKQVPAGMTTVGIGEPFTYTLTIPVLYDPLTGTYIDTTGTDVPIGNVRVTDDLNAIGADLTLLGTPTVTWAPGSSGSGAVPHTFTNVGGVLNFDITPGGTIPAGDQLQIQMTLVPDSTNVIGTQFFNTASWNFSRSILLDPDGDGVFELVLFDPLPGENGVSEILTIGAPDLVVIKNSLDTALSPGATGNFTIDVQNNGNTDAWNATIVDQLPNSATATMCTFDPSATVVAQVFEADGTTPASAVLTPGVDYSLSFDNSAAVPAPCTLNLTMLSANTVIEPGQRLIINYQAQLAIGASVNGQVLTNYAGATEWFSADSSNPRTTFTRTITDGTPADDTDHEDSFDVTVGLAGYYFQKTVSNIDSGANPATTAQAGDTLRYRLRVFNVNQTINGVSITDQLDMASFDPAISLVSNPAGATVNFNAGSGLLTIDGGVGSLDVAQGTELVFEFDIQTLATLNNGDLVSNQAFLDTTSGKSTFSDDPFVNGVDDPDVNPPDPDATVVTIQQPGSLSKTDGPASAVIGDTFTYTITVPETPVATPLYDVRILDTLGVDSTGTTTVADVSYISATGSGGTWTLTNSGTASVPVIEDLGSGIDIPAGGQAVITMTVRLDNTLTNQAGVQFYNTATYTYNRTNGVNASQVAGSGVTTASATTIFEPGITTLTKVADNTTPTAGDVIHYTVTMQAQSGANVSDVFDVVLTDSLDLGLAYVAGSATVSAGLGVGSGNTISSTDVTGDGISTPQQIIWGTSNVDIDIQAGDTITFEYDVLVLDNVLANQTLNNSIIALWTSIDGADSNERDGSDGIGGLNDYITPPAVETLTTPDINTTITKVRSDDTYGSGDDDVRIGDVVEYTLTIPVPEGTLGNLQLVDTLPQGLDFKAVVSINGNVGPSPYTAVAPFTYADILNTDIVEAGNPATGPTTVTWNLGNITNQPNDGLSDNFVIVYRAQVLNNDVIAQVNSTPLNNTVVMSYDTASGTVTASDIDTSINVLQPLVSVSKSAVPANGDIFIEANEVITYTVDVVNSGAAPAYDLVLEDVIPAGLRTAGVTTTSITRHTTSTDALVATLTSFSPASLGAGVVQWNFDIGAADAYTIPPGETLRVVYTVQADAGIAQGLTLTNAATATLYYSFDDEAVPAQAVATDREIYGPTNTASTTLYTGAPPSKALLSPLSAQAAIGEEIIYQIMVPGTASASTLYDVQVSDVLDTNLVNLSAATIITGGTGVTDNSTAAGLDLDINEIAAGTQVVIELHVRLNNVLSAQQGVAIDNTVTYTYAYTAGGARQPAMSSTDIVTVDIIEPQLTASKAVTLVTAAPITGGSILEYAVTIPNAGSATAYDVNVVDTLAAGLTLDGSFTPTATIGGTPVAGFIATPSGAPNGPLVWGRNNADGSLKIPAASTLILTYRVLIDASVQSNVTLSNSVITDWTSLDGVSADERTGADGIGGLNDYITAPATTSVYTVDNNSFSKAVTADSDAATGVGVLRVGDTVTYQLSLNLQEGTTSNVTVSDALPAGLVFDSMVSISPASGAADFSYTIASQPAAGASGTLLWDFGTVVNTPSGDGTPVDALVIEYVARVIENDASTIGQAPSTGLSNTATLGYQDGNGVPVVDPARLESQASITVLQPVLTAVSKTGNGGTNTAATPLNVNVASDTVQFQLESCNTGLAPAYGVQLSDVLATQLDQSSIAGPTVTINGTVATAGADYIYTPPAARGGTLQFELLTAVNPGQCVTVDYDIGFYTDFGANQLWNNSVTLTEYWSLPVSSGQPYSPSGPAEFFMTNIVGVAPLSKVISSPAGSEITIGEDVVYTITVPAAPINAVLNNVMITDPLNAVLEYAGATAVDGGGVPVVLLDTTIGQDVSLSITQIPAGEQIIITLNTRLANNAAANAGVSFTNTAAYTYSGSPGPMSATSAALKIVEPLITINKSVNPTVTPKAGDILTYSVTFTASGGTAGDNYSDAFDLSIVDNLSLGLVYQNGTARVDVAGNTIADPAVNGDGTSTAQTLTWNLAGATADIDVVEGTTVTVSYDVLVLDSILAGQDLSNSASTQWTGLDEAIGDPVNADERTGSGTPVENDYFTGPVTTTLTTLDNTTFSKTRLSDTYNGADANVRVGDLVDFELRLHLDEGSHSGLVVSDVLDQGLQFEQVVSVNGDTAAPYSSVAPFVYNDIPAPSITGNAALGASTVTWTLGDVVNTSDNNATNDDFIIIYRARLLNNDVFTQTSSTTVTNTATLDYNIATGPKSLNDNESVSLLQPLLTVSKSAAPGGGDSVINAGELITFTVDVVNSGLAPAYDTVVEDILPAGMRQGGVTTTSVSVAGVPVLPPLAPAYDLSTGTATWNFDNGVADAYTIPAGATLRIVYTVLADADLGPGMTMSNAAKATLYYSFDDEDVPVNGNITEREVYGPSNTATTTLTTLPPVALVKDITQPTAYIGEQFSYRITVPAVKQTTALNDVRILDNLNTSTAAMTFISVTKISTTGIWVPVNTGDSKNLVIEDIANGGIDIPADDQAIIEITVVLDDSTTNFSGQVFNNTANYTYDVTQISGLPDTSPDMTIVGPDTVVLEKSGPATMQIGVPGTFVIDVQNTGTSPAWDMTITDQLPNPTPGGMCDAAPANITAEIFAPDKTTSLAVLTQGVDYTTSFSPNPGCVLTLTMQSTAAAIGVDQWLIVTYEASIDSDSIGGASLTNVAAATQWFSGDTTGAGATGQIHTYTGLLTDGTEGTPDEQGAHTVLTEFPVLVFQKSVINVTTGQNPGADASPGDTLRYTLDVQNTSSFGLSSFTLVDDLDAINASAMFAADSLKIISVPALAVTSNTDRTGGSKGSGLLEVSNLSLDAQGGANDSLQIIFEVTLVPVIDSGTVVLNQASLRSFGIDIGSSDSADPALTGPEDPTRITITSAPLFQVQKTSTDITGDPAVLNQGDTLRYTLTVKNIGQENAVNTLLSDQIPANTSYVAGSTTLNTVTVADPGAGISALVGGMLINAPENTTAGYLRADTDVAANNVATITFDVVINATVVDGTVISNQGFVSGDGTGSGVFPQQPSDDPDTVQADDPTLDVVGSSPLVDALKTVALDNDVNSNGFVDPGDTLRYTITMTNSGNVAATGVVLTDAVPANTTYVGNSATLNGIVIPDPGVNVSPFISGVAISSSDLTPPLPLSGIGTLTAGQSAVVIFKVQVGTTAVPLPPAGTLISNQGFVSSNETPTEPTDADGNDANGDQPTDIVVGNVQQLAITKQVLVVGGDTATAGGQLEYVVQVTNIGSVPASNVVITDTLNTAQMGYIAGSGLLNGVPVGLTGPALTANYSATYGDLPVAGVAELRFRVLLSTALNINDTVSNTANVDWNIPASTLSASVDIGIGGTPGTANLNGQVWQDSNFNNLFDSNEPLLQDWSVQLYRNSVLLASTLSDANGVYQFSGLAPNLPSGEDYEIRFVAPGATAMTASLGTTNSAFTDGPQRISDILAASGASVQNLNLPRQANGIVYDSVLRVPVAGVQLTMINQSRSNQPVPASCFTDPVHASQVTLADGYYKFDLNFSDPARCAQGDEYEIQVQPPADDFTGTTSVIIPPVEPVTGVAQDVPNCPGTAADKIPATAQHCENSASDVQPPATIAPRTAGTDYYLKFLFNALPFTGQIYNNHIPVDGVLDAAVAISKVAGKLNVTRSDLVPYTITFNNTLGVPLFDVSIIDNFPAGFKYVSGSARVDGAEIEPEVNGRLLTWPGLSVDVNESRVIKLLLVVGSGVGEGEYVNTARAINTLTGGDVSGVATATVRVIPDPTFDCTDVIGKVFDDKNLNSYQDQGERGIPGVQVATARGLRVTTDSNGRFHITCAIVANEVRGSNFIMKLDDRTLPSGYRVTTENPRVQRATRGKMMKFNFGTAIHRVVRLDLADGVFEKDSTELRPQWRSRIDLLITELQKEGSILRLSYLAENEDEDDVDDRLDAIEDLISARWEDLDCCYKLVIEKEVFWRKGSPSAGREFKE